MAFAYLKIKIALDSLINLSGTISTEGSIFKTVI
jgi:hypothetical protein